MYVLVITPPRVIWSVYTHDTKERVAPEGGVRIKRQDHEAISALSPHPHSLNPGYAAVMNDLQRDSKRFLVHNRAAERLFLVGRLYMLDRLQYQ